MSAFETTGRFMRPVDVGTPRRSRRRVQARRLLMLFANLVLVAVIAVGATWLWQRAHEDSRFAVRSIEVSGRNHAAPAEVQAVLSGYRGANLFRLDIAVLQSKLGRIGWVENVAVEKSLPNTLRIEIVERVPAALFVQDGQVSYVDANGVVFAPFDEKVGAAELPRIELVDRERALGCVKFLGRLRLEAPDLFARVATIRPADSSGWIVLDRMLAAPVTLPEEASLPKWRLLDRIAAADGLDGSSIEYADLRFRKQIVVKKRVATGAAAAIGGQQNTGEGGHVQD